MRITHALILVLATGLVGACAKDRPDGSTEISTSATAKSVLTRIEDPSLVCMVNNTYMGKAQIPVEVDGKTYFGCCPACKARLANEPDTRLAIDPVTGATVDKATAVIAKNAGGDVFYFASEQSLRGYKGAP